MEYQGMAKRFIVLLVLVAGACRIGSGLERESLQGPVRL